ncbi:hypothetical protein Poli38472_013255 [Pythium oligandrum]|uniref:Uncharacterized protein n=1 Tax=Pythium oligandrum TaxID=41045 RepID=A0A8K1FC11_PYTOL|nr:hypothetical protein Poli38472_013255 [Pythium oligandrum]|eukprot:TMW55364.1 hypothetical protein Poli38472_013255 [Pythium oligandrum]
MEDDDDSLLAILAFLDAEEVGLPLLDDEEAVPRQPSSQDFPSKRRKRRSVKEIIDELRDQAQDLEAQLYLLRCQENHIIHGQSRGYVEDSSNAVAMWKNVASRQYQQRQESQSLNAHLHQLVTSKAKIIEDMQRLLRRGITWPKTPSSLLWMPFHSFQEFRPSWLHQSWRLLHNAAVEMYDHLELVMTEVEMWDQHELRVVAVGGVDRKAPTLPFSQLYRFATPKDKVLVGLGVICAGINGALFPCMALVFGDAIAAFQSADGSVNRGAVNTASLNYVYIAVGLFITDYFAYVAFIHSAERQMKELRAQALKHMLYMDIGWYDSRDALQLSSRLTGDTVKIKDGMGQKLGDSVKYTCQFLTGYIIGFSRGWDMTLVMSCVMPFMALSLGYLLSLMRTGAERAQKLYAEAGAVAEETLGSIRTVASLNSEQRAMNKYNAKATDAEAENIHLAKYSSVIFGLFMACTWIMYAAGLWYGGSRVTSGETTPSEVFQAFMGVLLGTVSLAQISPNINSIAEAMGAAAALYEILDTPSPIDAAKEDEGFVPASCQGHIEAINLEFTYPSRPDAKILNGYSVTVDAGQTVAFVGASGGGKSTLIGLLERFYDPQAGQILLDGRDIKTINIKWLRSQIGMVSQEPVLFATTILENITNGGDDVTEEQAIEAAKMANAHNFIMSLPQQYETLVGEKGVSLSGGQKQRVAIARAIVRNPTILVLDEATSALDSESERIVQGALNDLMDRTRMTTLVIAHRLSTIRRADKIVVLSGGRVVEEGNHDELLAIQGGIYHGLYTIQEGKAKEEAAATYVDLAMVQDQDVSSTMDVERSLSTRSSRSFMACDLEGNDIKNPTPLFGIMDAIAFSRPERWWFVFGILGACVCGFALPASAILLSEMITTMTMLYGKYEATRDHALLDDLSDKVTVYGSIYVGGAVGIFLFTTTQTFCFRFMAEKLTTRLRSITFASLCRQNIAFFDEKSNATGALTADLATNAAKVAMMSGDTLGRVVQVIFTLISALVISFALGSWLLTLVLLAIIPLLIISEAIRMNQMKGAEGLSDELANVGAAASEALGNIRTVVSLGLEKSMTNKFYGLLEAPLAHAHKEAQVNGLALGFSSFIALATNALVFWYGGKLVEDKEITMVEMMRTLMAIMMSAQSIGSAVSFLADSEKTAKAGAAIVAIRDRSLPIDSFDESGGRPGVVEGKIEFRDITFRYPTRPEVTVLRHYNLTIEAGQTVAFCGPSGGGKSTCISLIERFYDPVCGQVLLDGRDLKSLNVQWLRHQIGLVGQEPTLFAGTIAENVGFGLEDKPSQESIESAARMANAHDFIMHFPNGYETQVGAKGEMLSGGQKQRIAIARAILKNPRILLLDEATSALDTESEKIVQEALDKVLQLKRRTTIIIAHRLSTIRKADKICVVSGGRIAEQGTHAGLLGLQGIYRRLVESAAS